jgi:hypothetical protein
MTAAVLLLPISSKPETVPELANGVARIVWEDEGVGMEREF